MLSATATHLLRSPPPNPPSRSLPHLRPPSLLRSPSAAGPNGVGAVGSYKTPKPQRDLLREWVWENDGFVRVLPIYVGGFSLLVVLLNRSFSNIPPVADASSSQSRADILSLALAVTNILAGLVWLSIRPKNISPVVLHGVECRRLNPLISERAVLEMLWAWDSLSAVTCCRSLVVVYDSNCVLQIGVAAESPLEDGDAMDVDVKKLLQGSLCKSAMETQKQSYLANLSLYPGKSELPFLPTNTQSVILQPIGDNGVAIIGGNTIRGFNNTDQAWITLIAEKLEATLSTS
ncbi:protein COFACTOR ASSEMBLY OF COMPLEX C SUBUNIT B CCB4, chloroplastic isoform X1 [Dioscorea cayenensis subsp. rotundata]|uniref:Protein COFACTOR ASSEMBLY OF COMPLEX C SUBUNIT B CCB4, chloroplastic isoform X1 n=1 Tax=Dioscorea cayennensis subsp. rotundata TaxID=55577 RepID=A0AB40B012_DIOCR|nr:protein COFACTOR ASSEMBLY OF COMPLEX C SUBUNIT B CCB4, chloroplastic isoform X1 [Dioscorea cayenensis subsp. rotundata]